MMSSASSKAAPLAFAFGSPFLADYCVHISAPPAPVLQIPAHAIVLCGASPLLHDLILCEEEGRAEAGEGGATAGPISKGSGSSRRRGSRCVRMRACVCLYQRTRTRDAAAEAAPRPPHAYLVRQ